MIDFGFSDDEQAVVEASTKLASSADPWSALVEGGWLDVLVTEPDSGFRYLGLLSEELGSAGVAVPLPGTAVAWPILFGEATDRPVGVVDGDFAEDGLDAEVVVILSDRCACAYDRFSVEPVSGLDSDLLARVVIEGDAAAVSTDPAKVLRARLLTAAVAAAEMAGAIRRVAEITARYIAERHQFGRAISSFQVVQHRAGRLASLSEAATWVARLAYLAPEPTHVHAAKGWISSASVEVSTLAHQLHGAIGFTEEYGLQRLTKRLRTLRFAWGDDGMHHLALGRVKAMETSS